MRAERAAYCAAVALWWAGCFPERIESVGGAGTLRAYSDFAGAALDQAARILEGHTPDQARLYARVATRTSVLLEALRDTKADYLGRAVHSPGGRLGRYLSRLEDQEPGAPE